MKLTTSEWNTPGKILPPQRVGERFGFLLSHRAALVGAVAADLAFDRVEVGVA